MSWEAWGDPPDYSEDGFSEAEMEAAFKAGAQACREVLARFVEQGGDVATASSIRLNWVPSWGADPGAIAEIPADVWEAVR